MTFCRQTILRSLQKSLALGEINRINVGINAIVFHKFDIKIDIFDHDIFLLEVLRQKLFGLGAMDVLDL